MRGQSGMTLFETLVVLLIAGLVALVGVTAGMPFYERERLRATVHDVQGTMQLGRMEALKRNRPCRLVVETGGKLLQVWDGMGTDSASDDALLHTTNLPSSVEFAHPQGAAAVTLYPASATTYEVVFDKDGTVGAGDGEVVLHGGGRYERLTLYVAGGVRVTRWNGSAWQS